MTPCPYPREYCKTSHEIWEREKIPWTFRCRFRFATLQFELQLDLYTENKSAILLLRGIRRQGVLISLNQRKTSWMTWYIKDQWIKVVKSNSQFHCKGVYKLHHRNRGNIIAISNFRQKNPKSYLNCTFHQKIKLKQFVKVLSIVKNIKWDGKMIVASPPVWWTFQAVSSSRGLLANGAHSTLARHWNKNQKNF